MVQLKRTNCRPLLRKVNGKPHAGAEDHIETSEEFPSGNNPRKEKAVFQGRDRKSNVDILADPISSGDEGKETETSLEVSDASKPGSSSIHPPQRKRNGPRAIGVRVPTGGSYSKYNEKEKAQRGHTPGSMSGQEDISKASRNDADDSFDMFDMESGPRKKPRTFGRSNTFGSSQGSSSSNSKGNGTKGHGTAKSQTEFFQPPPVAKMKSRADMKPTNWQTPPEPNMKAQKGISSRPPSQFKIVPSTRGSTESREKSPHTDSSASSSTRSIGGGGRGFKNPLKPQTLVKPNARKLGKKGGEETAKVEEKPRFFMPPDLPPSLPRIQDATLPIVQRDPLADDPDLSSISTSSDGPVFSSQVDPFGGDISPEVPSSSRSVCPMCGGKIDPDHLLSFTESRVRMDWRAKEQFCKEHTHRSALEEYKARGYPEIDWGGLSKRLKKHNTRLQEILDGERPSHFKSLLAKKVATGKNRTLKQAMNADGLSDLTPGYYGSKGARLLMEHINRHFSHKLQQIAPLDRLIAAKGVPNYIHAVLVPELATALVIQDLNVTEDEAIKILGESQELGNLLHEEEYDVVKLCESQISESEVVWDMWNSTNDNSMDEVEMYQKKALKLCEPD